MSMIKARVPRGEASGGLPRVKVRKIAVIVLCWKVAILSVLRVVELQKSCIRKSGLLYISISKPVFYTFVHKLYYSVAVSCLLGERGCRR